jgi:gliding motility-associated lipoprotein GldB
MRYIFILIAPFLLFACTGSNDKRNAPKVSINIERLEEKMMRCETREELDAFLKKNPVITHGFLGSGLPGEDTTLSRSLFEIINNPHFDTLYEETKNVFPDLENIEQDFETAFSNIKYYYPGFEPPKVYSMITGMTSDLFISDSAIVIGIDFYLGKDAKYKPLGYPKYISRRFEEDFIVPSIMIYLSDEYSKTNLQDNSLLAEMIYYGKAFAFAKEMLPETPDSLIVWYTAEELNEVKAHEDIVWAHFIQNELLYETSQRIKQKYIGERPNTLEIGNECPGRVGAWLGWEIVKKYREKDNNFQSLMEEPDATVILRQSGYKPDPH